MARNKSEKFPYLIVVRGVRHGSMKVASHDLRLERIESSLWRVTIVSKTTNFAKRYQEFTSSTAAEDLFNSIPDGFLFTSHINRRHGWTVVLVTDSDSHGT